MKNNFFFQTKKNTSISLLGASTIHSETKFRNSEFTFVWISQRLVYSIRFSKATNQNNQNLTKLCILFLGLGLITFLPHGKCRPPSAYIDCSLNFFSLKTLSPLIMDPLDFPSLFQLSLSAFKYQSPLYLWIKTKSTYLKPQLTSKH